MQAPRFKPRVVQLDRAIMELRIRQLFDARMRGDPEAVTGHFAEDGVAIFTNWQGHSSTLTRVGREHIAELSRALHTMYENFGSTFHRFLFDENKVAVHRTSRVRNRGTGRTVDVGIWNFVTFRGDKIIELVEVSDTLKIRELES